MIRCLSLGLLFAASLIGSLLLFSDVSKAQSEFDNTYHTTDNLILSSRDGQENYDVTDLPLERLMAGLDTEFEGRNIRYERFFKTSGSADNITNDEEERERLYDLWIKAEEWTINQVKMPTGEDFVEYCFTSGENTERKLSVNFNPGEDPIHYGGKAVTMGRNDVVNNDQNRVYRVTFRLSPQQSSTLYIRYEWATTAVDNCVISTENRDRNITTNSGVRSNFVTSIDQINYPEDYFGKEIRDTFLPIQDKTFLPEWSWSVTQDGKLTVTSQNNDNANLDAEAVFDLWKDSKDWQFPSTEVVDSERQRPYHSAKFEHQLVKEEQWITVTIDHYWQFCLMEGTCEDEYPEGITDIETVIFQIYWDGKSFIAGNNANGQEDCELQEDGGIYRRVCNSEDQEPVIMRTLRSLNSDMHGLTQIITAPLSFITSLITYNNNCTALNLPLPSAMNRDLNLPCMTPYYQQYLGFLFNLYQTILTALVCYYCFVNTLAYVKRGQNPKNDRIEVAHL